MSKLIKIQLFFIFFFCFFLCFGETFAQTSIQTECANIIKEYEQIITWYDTNKSGRIERTELDGAIDDWKMGTRIYSTNELLAIMKFWKYECYFTTTNDYPLYASKTGTGTGLVSSSDQKINCGNICSASYAQGTSVTLYATPSSGSTFAGWSGACTGTATTCTVSMSQVRSVTARFDTQQRLHYLSVSHETSNGKGKVISTPSGIDCGTSCYAGFSEGTTVTLKAIPEAGSKLGRWSGECHFETSDTCRVTMNAGKGVSIRFDVSDQWQCGNLITFNYKGKTVTYGTVLSGNYCWMDRNLGANGIATNYKDVQAYGDLFQWGRLADRHQERISGTTKNKSNSDIPGHSNFILAAGDWRSPQNNNLWQKSGINNPCPRGWRVPTLKEWQDEISLWNAKNYNGAFSSPLKLTTGGRRDYTYGTLSGVSNFANYWSSAPGGTSVASGLHFSAKEAFMGSYYRSWGFSVRCIQDGDTIIPSDYTLSISKTGTGAGVVSTSDQKINCGNICSASYAQGTSVTLYATPSSGSTFTGWSGACTGTARTCTLSMTQARSVMATFETQQKLQYLSVSHETSNGKGKVISTPSGIDCGTSCYAGFSEGTTVTLKAIPEAGSKLGRWSGECHFETSDTCRVTMNAGKGVSIRFDATDTQTCKRANPTITLEPATHTGKAGEYKEYLVKVTNNDSSTCQSTRFNVSHQCNTGWNCSLIGATWVSLEPGQTQSGPYVRVTSPTTAQPGSYTFTTIAANQSHNNYQGTRTGTYVVERVVAACKRANPTITLEPATHTGKAGEYKEYLVKVTNNDSSTCQSTRFNVSHQCNTGWNCSLIGATWVSLEPGQTQSGPYVRVTSPTTAQPGSYTFRAVATNQSDSRYSASIGGTYTIGGAVAGEDPTTGTLSVNKTRVNVGENIILTVKGKDNNGLTSLWAFYQGQWHTKNVSGTTASQTFTFKETNSGTYIYYGYVYGKKANGTKEEAWTTPSMVRVEVVMTDTQTCKRANPTITLNPTSSNHKAGDQTAYGVFVTNNDSTQCGNSTFDLTRICPSGWTCNLTISSMNIAPGQTYGTSLYVTSPNNASSGTHNITVKATNRTGQLSGQVSAGYVIGASACRRAAPTVTINPTSFVGKVGRYMGYGVYVMNNDSVECGSSTFNLTRTCPTAWTCNLTITSMTLSPGGLYGTTLGVTPPNNASIGMYNLKARATNQASQLFGERDANYIVE